MNEWKSVFSTFFDVGISLCITRQGIEFLRGWAQNRTGVRQNRCLISFTYSFLVPVWKNRDHYRLTVPCNCRHWIKPDKELSSIPEVQRAFRDSQPKSQPEGRIRRRGISVLRPLLLACLMKRCPGVLRRLGVWSWRRQGAGLRSASMSCELWALISPLRAQMCYISDRCVNWTSTMRPTLW